MTPFSVSDPIFRFSANYYHFKRALAAAASAANPGLDHRGRAKRGAALRSDRRKRRRHTAETPPPRCGGGLAAVIIFASRRKCRAHRRISAHFEISGQHSLRVTQIYAPPVVSDEGTLWAKKNTVTRQVLTIDKYPSHQAKAYELTPYTCCIFAVRSASCRRHRKRADADFGGQSPRSPRSPPLARHRQTRPDGGPRRTDPTGSSR